MMLSSVEFVVLFVVIGLLLVHSLWCARSERKAKAKTVPCPSRAFATPTFIELCDTLEALGHELKDDRVVYMALSYSEQEPCEWLRSNLVSEIFRCQDRIAVAKDLKDAIYLESVFGVDDGRDHCEGDQDDMHYEPVAQTKGHLYWFDEGCVFDTWEFEGEQFIGLRDELLAKVRIAKGQDGFLMWAIEVEPQHKWLADDYVEDGVLRELMDLEVVVHGLK